MAELTSRELGRQLNEIYTVNGQEYIEEFKGKVIKVPPLPDFILMTRRERVDFFSTIDKPMSMGGPRPEKPLAWRTHVPSDKPEAKDKLIRKKKEERGGDAEPSICNGCGKPFDTVEQLNDHIKNNHPEMKAAVAAVESLMA